MGILHRNNAPEPSPDTAPGDGWFRELSNPDSQYDAQPQQYEPGYDQPAPPHLTIVEHPNGTLTYSNGVPLPDDIAYSYRLLKHNQQGGGGSYTDESQAAYSGQYGDSQSSNQTYPTELSISITEDIRVTVGDPRYVEFGAQVLRERYDRNQRMHDLAYGQSALPAPVQYDAQPYQDFPAIEPGTRQLTGTQESQYYPQGSPYVPDGYRRLQDQEELPMDDQFAPDQEQESSTRNSVKRSPKLIRVAGSLMLAAVTAYGVHGGLSWIPFYGPEHQIQKSDFLKNEAVFWSSIGGIAGGK